MEKKEAQQENQQGIIQVSSELPGSTIKNQDGPAGNQNRGREMQKKIDFNRRTFGGSSEPPKLFYKPTGSIFGFDKPHPTSAAGFVNQEDTTRVVNLEKEQGQQPCKQNVIHDTSKSINTSTSDKAQIEEGKERTRGNNMDFNSENGIQKESMELNTNKMIAIKDKKELQIDIFDGEWEEVGSWKSRKKPDNKFGSSQRSHKHNKISEEAIADITRNSFDELMEDEEELLTSTSKSKPKNSVEEGKDLEGTKSDSQDEWADRTSSSSSEEEEEEEENTSEEEEEEEEEEDEGEIQEKEKVFINIRRKEPGIKGQEADTEKKTAQRKPQKTKTDHSSQINPNIRNQKGDQQKPSKFTFHD
ncbi:histone acetyltransferase KAT6B [Capsicum galapagoense]